MTKVEMLEREVSALPAEELSQFRQWFAAFDAKEWDREFEGDAKNGTLDSSAESALADHRAGRTRPL